MSKKKDETVKRGSKESRSSWNPESSRYYFPLLALLLFVGVIALFQEFLFSDQMLYGSDMINAGIFFRHFYVDFVKTTGSMPVWNPYIFGGLPFIDAFHGDILYPLSTLKFAGNLYRMLGISLVLHIFMAGIFMYFAARQFRLSRVASSLSAAAYMFSGYLVSLVAPGHDGKIFVTTLFPLVILFLERAFEKKPVLNLSFLALVIGLIILTPHLQLSYYSLWVVAFYGIFKLVLLYRSERSVGKVGRMGGLLGAAVVVGILVSAVQLYPGYVYTTQYSPRADSKRGYDWATSWSMHEEEALSLAVPEFSGSNAGENNYYWGKNAFKDNSEYAGIIPLFLAAVAVFFTRRREAIFFGALALFAFVYALGGTTPLFRLFFYLIPNVKSLRAPSTIMFVFAFSVSLLAGMAIQFLLEKGRSLAPGTRKKLLIYLLSVPAGFLVLALLFSAAGEGMLSLYSSIFYSGIKSISIGQGSATKWQLALLNLPNIQRGIWIVFLMSGLSAGAVLLYLNRKAGMAILLAIPLLVIIDGIRFNARFVSTFNYRQQIAPNAISNYLASRPGQFRVFDLETLPKNFLPYYGIQVVTGYHGNQLRWYDEFLGGPALTNLANPRFLNLVGSRYILAPATAQIPPEYFGPKLLTPEQRFGSIVLYRNDNALPRAFLVDQYQVIPDRKNIYPLLLTGQGNPATTAFLEEAPPVPIAAGETPLLPPEIVGYADDSVAVNVRADRNSLLILTDNYYRAWDAYVDGNKVAVMRADGTFRAVAVPAGSRQVVFRYNRSMNNQGLALSLLALAIIAGVIVTDRVQSAKKKKQVVETA